MTFPAALLLSHGLHLPIYIVFNAVLIVQTTVDLFTLWQVVMDLLVVQRGHHLHPFLSAGGQLFPACGWLFGARSWLFHTCGCSVPTVGQFISVLNSYGLPVTSAMLRLPLCLCWGS